MYTDTEPNPQHPNTTYSHYTNKYVLTKEMCAEAELSRIDIGIAYVCTVIIFFFLVLLSSMSDIPSLSDAVYDLFSSPSAATILQLSGTAGITFISPVVVILCFLHIFPKLVGEKRFNEHMKLVPSKDRTLSFYEDHVTVQGKFSKKLPYRELRRTGETRHLYLLYFMDKRILIIDKAGFRKGNLRELKQFLKNRRTFGSKLYGKIRWLPVIACFLLFGFILWAEANL